MRFLPPSGFALSTPFGQFGDICRMVKIEHSVFALPYAWAGAFLAAGGLPSGRALIFLTIAMIAARSFAMAFNRLADLPFDRDNPRTCDRPLVTGVISAKQTWAFCALMALIFIACCAALNTVCLWLSVPALLFAAAYSLLKRFTPFCHFWLGATLGLAPLVVKGIFEIIQEINKQGVTVLLIEQNANMALKIADLGYVLETGRITLTGSGRDLLKNEDVKKAYLGT